ncbi:MAG: hypothetical protein PHO57_05475 [Acidithiobacillus sp.]|nr:hypothetical protein [Acidithiobacillus sp.]
MKSIIVLLTVVGMLGLGSALAGTESVLTAQALWQEIQILQQNHVIIPESRPYQVGSRTVDAFTTDLANAAAVQSIAQAGSIIHVSRYADHSLLVKENYGMDKQVTGVTAMLKLSGYDAGDRNWVMAAYFPKQEMTPAYAALIQKHPEVVVK